MSKTGVLKKLKGGKKYVKGKRNSLMVPER